MKRWQAKHRRNIEKRISAAWQLDWARSLCQVILWWAEKHPDSLNPLQVKQASQCLQALSNGNIEKLSIYRDRTGFRAFLLYGHGGIRVTTKGLPKIPLTYEQEI